MPTSSSCCSSKNAPIAQFSLGSTGNTDISLRLFIEGEGYKNYSSAIIQFTLVDSSSLGYYRIDGKSPEVTGTGFRAHDGMIVELENRVEVDNFIALFQDLSGFNVILY